MNTKKNNKTSFRTVFNKNQNVKGCLFFLMLLVGTVPTIADNKDTAKLKVSGRIVESLRLSSLPLGNEEETELKKVSGMLMTYQNKSKCSMGRLCSKLLVSGKADYHYSFLKNDKNQKCQSTINGSSSYGILNASGSDIVSCRKVTDEGQNEETGAIMFFD